MFAAMKQRAGLKKLKKKELVNYEISRFFKYSAPTIKKTTEITIKNINETTGG